MSTINLYVKYKSVKNGFLVEFGDIDALVKTVGMNNLLWGGNYNPIIPISKDTTYTEKLIRLFSIDLLCPINHTTLINNFIKKYNFLKILYFYGESIFLDNNKSIITYLDSYNVIYNI
jgi:hypothetical protein